MSDTVVLQVYDTTLRDGTQREGLSFTVEDKISVARTLDRLGVHFIEGGWPGANPKDTEFFRLAKAGELKLKTARLSAFSSTRRPGVTADNDLNLRAVVASGAGVCAVFGKSWDLHVTGALQTDLEENLRMIEESVRFLKRHGLYVIFDAEHFYDGYRHYPNYALKTLAAAEAGGADVLALCDTNGGSLPDNVAEATREVAQRTSTPLGIHAHNDGGLAVANTLAAVTAGAVHVQGTINGYGERCGNADLCVVLPNLELRMGRTTIGREAIKHLVEVSRFVGETANLGADAHQPFVGRSAFAHKGGVHVSALLKDPTTYEHMDPATVGNKRRVVISELAGASNVRYKLGEYGLMPPIAGAGSARAAEGAAGIAAESAVEGPVESAADRTVRAVTAAVKELEYDGYSFEGAEGTFELLFRRQLGLAAEFFRLEGFRVTVQKGLTGATGALGCEATVKVVVGGRTIHTVAEGDGPVNALDNALRQALRVAYPELDGVRLTDYKVRVLDGKAGTASKVRVHIESSGFGRSWGTVGVSENIIAASWEALVDGMNYGLLLTRARLEAGG